MCQIYNAYVLDAVPMAQSDIYFREYYNITEVKLKLHSSC